MDRHLTYVAMTRHRDGAQLYAGMDEFSSRQAGRLVEHGTAPYHHDPNNRDSYFVTLENDRGQKHTVWGVDLERAMKEAAPEIGDRMALEHRGSETVRLPDGSSATRNAWKVQDAGELAYSQLENRLSRSGAKETTLDYSRDFAERRGIAEQLGVRSEIELNPDREPTQEKIRAERQSPRPSIEAEKRGEDPRQVSRAEDLAQDRIQEHGGDRQQRQRRNPFEGLKLGRGAATQRPQEDRAEPTQERPERAETPRRGTDGGCKALRGRHCRDADFGLVDGCS